MVHSGILCFISNPTLKLYPLSQRKFILKKARKTVLKKTFWNFLDLLMETSQGSIFTEAVVFLSISKTFIIAIYSLINLFLIMHFSAIRRESKRKSDWEGRRRRNNKRSQNSLHESKNYGNINYMKGLVQIIQTRL